MRESSDGSSATSMMVDLYWTFVDDDSSATNNLKDACVTEADGEVHSGDEGDALPSTYTMVHK